MMMMMMFIGTETLVTQLVREIAGETNAGTVLIEESAATLTQFLLAGLVLQSGEEAPKLGRP
jgi:hypothetical protein